MSHPFVSDATDLSTAVRTELVRGAERPDSFSTRPTAELQAILRDAASAGIEHLINTGSVQIDFEDHRIFRDAFWKGSFAKDSLLGFEEVVRNAVLGNSAENAARTFTGGSFWKRFDRVQDGVAFGYVVNYEISALPGLPEVRSVIYPDESRPYFKNGDTVLLLTYTNEPYRLVYDTIKIIDAQNAIGVMHLGTFPTGVEVATFVLARHNYPFENMSVPDHETLFAAERAAVPSISDLAGTKWDGHLVLLTTPDSSLQNQVSPIVFRVGFRPREKKIEAQYHVGTAKFTRIVDEAALGSELRMIGSDYLLGKWVPGTIDDSVANALGDLLLMDSDAVHFVLKRSRAGAKRAKVR